MPEDRARLRSRLDLERIAFDGELAMQHALMNDAKFRRIYEQRSAASPAVSTRRKLLLSALRLSAGMAPEVAKALDDVGQRLELSMPVELYCVSDREINAFVVPPSDGRVLLGLTSAAVEGLDAAELRFVMGHELGHALFDHFRLSPAALVDEDDIAPVHLARLCAWMRYAELSADRVGLLCCDDFDAAVRAFFKLTSGLSGAGFLNHAGECATQLASVEHLESSDEDWFSTHPYSPLRIKALDLFSRSTTYHALLGRSAGEARFHRLLGKSGRPLTEVELEAEVASIMKLMDPSFLGEGDVETTAKIRELLALAGMAVALADGHVARGERRALGKLLGKRGVTRAKEHLLSLSAEEHEAELERLGHDLRLRLSPNRRRRVLEDLVWIALADNELHESELRTLAGVAEHLGLDATFVEQSLMRAVAELD